MTVNLIIPPSSFLLDERVFPSLGLLKLAAVLKSKYEINVLDLSGIKNYLDIMEVYLKEKDSNIFCITTTTPQLPFAIKIKDLIKKYKPPRTQQTPPPLLSLKYKYKTLLMH